jgi:hypothetical protein
MPSRAAALAALLALAACSRGGAPPAEPAPGALDGSSPLAALELDGDELARRLGSFEWAALVTWSAARGADRTRALEKHQVRQLASGDFRAALDLDPGSWPGSETGREIVFARGVTYARGRYAPFRERPTDRGRDARRFRDESLRLAADLARLYGPAVAAAPQGQGSELGRPARRFSLSLRRDAPPAARPPAPGASSDPDTRARLEFAEGRVPLVLEGELLLDAATGVPLLVRMKGILGERADPKVRVEFDLDAQVTAWGEVVGAVTPPQGALPDERKPRGVARALEQAGFGRKKAEPSETEPAEEEE